MDSTTVDLSTLPSSVPSMCIPRVFKNITEERIRRVLEQLNLGDIERVDMVQKRNDGGNEFQRVFIHFKRWYKNADADKARERLLTGNEIKIVYDDPWFWKISANRSVSGEQGQSRGGGEQRQRRGPAIEFDSSPRSEQKPRDQKRSDQRYGDHPRRDYLPRERDPRREQQRIKRLQPQPQPQAQQTAEAFVPRSPDSSPPRTREPSPSTTIGQAPDYNNFQLPQTKRRRVVVKIPQKAQAQTDAPTKEDGEI